MPNKDRWFEEVRKDETDRTISSIVDNEKLVLLPTKEKKECKRKVDGNLPPRYLKNVSKSSFAPLSGLASTNVSHQKPEQDYPKPT